MARSRRLSRKNMRSRRLSKNRKHTLTRKQKQLRNRKSLLKTLNQMGGYVRDGSTQFFKILKAQK